MEDQENQEGQEQSVGEQLAEQGKQMAGQAINDTVKKGIKEGIKAGGKAAGGFIKKALISAAPYLIPILIGIIAMILMFVIIDRVIEMSRTVLSSISTFVIAGDNGPIAPSPKEMIDLINKQLEEAHIDKKELYLGNSFQADLYLYKYMTASLGTQLPYIKDSTAKTVRDIAINTLIPGASALDFIKDTFGEEVQGIVKIKRQTGDSTRELTYKKYEDLLKLIEENDESALKYFSLDEEWMLCVAKSSKTTTKNPDGTIKTETTLIEGKMPYQTIISPYTVPFEFFVTLQQLSQNAEYVSAVADLVQGGEIELTIFDTTQVVTTEYTYRYKVRKKWIEEKEVERTREESKTETKECYQDTRQEVVAYLNNAKRGAERSYNEFITKTADKWYGRVTVERKEIIPYKEIVEEQKDETSEEKVETTIIKEEVNSITAAVTKADVWVIKQNANYKKGETTEYPLGKDGITNEIAPEATDKEIAEISEGEWQVGRSQTTKRTEQKEEVQLETSNVEIDESRFLGLWKSSWLGEYVPGASYAPDGFLVKYKIPNRIYKYESPVGNILSSEDLLYNQLEKSENTQVHAQLMRYLINYYKDPTTAVKPDLSIFTTSEFKEISWTKFGTGYWWPLQDITQTRITSNFGYRGDIGVEGASKNHKGIDIGVPVGSEIIASADGTVEVAGYNPSSGNWIRISHSNGIKTVYMHNSTLLVTVGQTVKQGDVIALSGNTGVSSGPHLHFGVQLNGEYVNPLDYVSTENPRPANVAPNVPANVEAWTSYIVQAFEELGYECTDEKINAILRQIKTESQGDQFIIQGIKDSNSGKPIKIGNGICPWCESPSGGSCGNTNIGHGLLQFIPTTFYSNMISGHTNIFNGYDQIITCITMLEKRSGPYTDYIGKGTGWG